MIKVTKRQWIVFSEALLEAFYRDAEFRLRKKFPLRTRNVTNEIIHRLIKEGIEKAESYRIIEKEDVMIYLEYVTYFGKDFDTHPDTVWASKILRIRNIPGYEKVFRLIDTHPLKQEFA